MAEPTIHLKEGRWYFTKEQIMNSFSRRCGIDFDKEMSHRQQAANLIQDIGQTLQVNQLCINTAIVYMHRFYMFHSFAQFHRNTIAACAIFLAAKVEEQPRKLDHVVKVAYRLTNRDQPNLETRSELYNDLANKLVMHENILLQTLGFDAVIDHPHTHVVKCCQLVRASKDMAQTSYFMATNSLHLTTMCLQYSPTIVACVCIHIVTKWSNIQIPPSSEGKNWWYYIDKTVTLETLEALTAEFLEIFNKCPARLKNRIKSGTQGVAGSPFPTGQAPVAQTNQPPPPIKKPEVPPPRTQVPVEHAAQTQSAAKEHKERTGQVLANHILQRTQKPPPPLPGIPTQQRQINGAKPIPSLPKPPVASHLVAPPQLSQAAPHMRSHHGHAPAAQQPQQSAPIQVKTQPVMARSKTYAGTATASLSQPPPTRPEPVQQPRPDSHQARVEKRPEMARPPPRPDQALAIARAQSRPEPLHPIPRVEQGLPSIRQEPQAVLRHEQGQPAAPVRSENLLSGTRLEQAPGFRPELQVQMKHPSSRSRPRPEQVAQRPDQTKRVVAVKSEPEPALVEPPRAPLPPPPLPKTKPPEPPQPPKPQPSIFGTLSQNVPNSLSQTQFSSALLGDFPVGMEQEVMGDSNWDLDFESALGLSPPYGALLGEKESSKNEIQKGGMPSLFSPEDDSNKRTEQVTTQAVQYQGKIVENTKDLMKKVVHSVEIQKTEIKTEHLVTKKIKEVTNIELREVKKEKPVYSTIDTKEHENLFSTLMATPATSIFGLPKSQKSPEKPKPAVEIKPNSPASISLFSPPQRTRTASTNEPSIVLKKVDQEYNSLKDGSSVTLAMVVPEPAEFREVAKVETGILKLSESQSSRDEKSHKKKKKEKHKKHKHKEGKEGDESRKDRKKHKKDKDKSKEKAKEEESPKKIKIKLGDSQEKPISPEKKDIPKLKIKAPKPPSPPLVKPPTPPEPPKAPEVKMATAGGLKLKIKMNNPPVAEVSRKRERSPTIVVDSPAKVRKVEVNGAEREHHERKKDKKDKNRDHKSHKKDSSREKERDSSSKRRTSESLSTL